MRTHPVLPLFPLSFLLFLPFTLATNIDIQVGQSGLSFTPNSTTASAGDTITFHYRGYTHNVIRGDPSSACTPLSVNGNGEGSGGAFYSGTIPMPDGQDSSPTTFVVTVNDTTQPIWYYCSVGRHCQSGMVGVVNPPYVYRSTHARTTREGAKAR